MSGRKRKQSIPVKSSEEKRLKMTWNMSELRSTSSFVVVSDEAIQSFGEGSRMFQSNSDELARGKRTLKRKQKQRISEARNDALSFVRLRIRSFFPEDLTCVLGTFEVLAVPAEVPDFRSLLNTAELVDLQLEDFNSVTVLVCFDYSEQSSLDESKTAYTLQSTQEKRAVVLEASGQQVQAIEYLESKGILSLVQKENRDNCLEVLVCLRKAAVTPLTFASEDTMMRKCDKMVKILMNWLFSFVSTSEERELNKIEPSSENHGSGFDDLYDAVKTIRESSWGIVTNRDEGTVSSGRPDSICEHRADMTNTQVKQNCKDINSIHCVDQGLECDKLGYPLHNDSCSSTTSDVFGHGAHKTLSQPDQVKANVQTVVEDDGLQEIQHPDLIPELRGYQKRAIQWMLAKELKSGHQKDPDTDLHILWREVKVLSGKNIFYNPYTGRFSMERYPVPPLPCGGILADEMGLGKTVEVLTCILNNPRPVTEHQASARVESQGGRKTDVHKVSKNSKFCTDETLPGKVTNSDCDLQRKGLNLKSDNKAAKPSLTTQLAGSGTCHYELHSINTDSDRTTEVCRGNSTNLFGPCNALALETCSCTVGSSQTQLVNGDTSDSVGSHSSSGGCITREVHQGNTNCLTEEPRCVLTHTLGIDDSAPKPSPVDHVIGDTSDSVGSHSSSGGCITREVHQGNTNCLTEEPHCVLTHTLGIDDSAPKPSPVDHVIGDTCDSVGSSSSSDGCRTIEIHQENTIEHLSEEPHCVLTHTLVIDSSAPKPSPLEHAIGDSCDSVGAGSHSEGCRTSEVHQGTTKHLSEEPCCVLTQKLGIDSSASKPSPVGHVVGETCDSVGAGSHSEGCKTSEVHRGTTKHLLEKPCCVLIHTLGVEGSASRHSPIGGVVGDACDSAKTSIRTDICGTRDSICQENPSGLTRSCGTLTNSVEVKNNTMKYLATKPVHDETSNGTCSKTSTCVDSCREKSTVCLEKDNSLSHEGSLELKSSMANTKGKPNNLRSLCIEKVHQNGTRNVIECISVTDITQQAEPSIGFQEAMSRTCTIEISERKLLHNCVERVTKKKSCTISTAEEFACTKTVHEIESIGARESVSVLSDEFESLSSSDQICRPIAANDAKYVTRDGGDSFRSVFGETHSGFKLSTNEESSWNTHGKSSSHVSHTSTDSSFCSRLSASAIGCQAEQNADVMNARVLTATSKAESAETTPNYAFLNSSFVESNNGNQVSSLENVPRSEDCKTVPSDRADGLRVEVSCICGDNDPCLDKDVLQCVDCSVVVHIGCFTFYAARQFVCPQCSVNRIPVQSRATLIISPASIAQQWDEEITRHTRPSTLKLLVYEGVSRQGFIPPEVLADHDVILTTYATLRADFYHLGVKQVNRSRRYQQRYTALPSPLTAVHFWRICLDEAQMVESTTAKAAEMALHLQCVHRWCVTGTPIQKGLEDIYGLFLFLGVYPYCQKVWWKKLLYNPYISGNRQPMYEVLAQLMWRSAKKDVLHEIQLPGQTEQVKWLTFTPVEQHFYNRQYEDCSATASKLLSRWQESDTRLSALDRHTVHRMLYPLLRLRQACCHPQAVRGGFLSLQKGMLTMDKLLDSLIARAKLECEEAHRQLLFALNGLAGIHIIKAEWPEAVECYRDSMRSWKEHEDKFKTDSLQKLHTVHNLADILSKDHQGCSHALVDDNLGEQTSELRKRYMLKPTAQVETAQQNLAMEEDSIKEIESQVNFRDPWWIKAIRQVSRPSTRGLHEELMMKIRNDLVGTEFLDRFTDLVGLQYVITTKLDMMESTRATLEEALRKLSVEPTTKMVITTAECCLRPVGDSHAKRCDFCQVDDVFTEYESRLFGHQGMPRVEAEGLTDGEPLDWHRHGNTGGLRADTATEKALKALFSFAKSHRLIKSDDKQEAQSHLTFIEARKKEFKFLRAVWFSLRERVSALDELDMCTTRLRLLLPGERLADDKHVIHPLQVEQQRMKFISDRISARIELRKKLGQLLYLSNLAKTQNVASGENPDLCPVCTKRLGVQWSVFSCGHCYCCQCVWVLLRQAGAGPRGHGNVHVKCPMCRVPTLAQEISYVSTSRQQTNKNEEDIVVKGSHSTKVEAVVRTLLHINRTDPAAKCLVFSTWQDVLDVIARALQENDVHFTQICGNKNFQASLHSFKHDPAVCVLLLPLHSGSNGLNIIEATHVLLVEPSLNPAHELQAVGRVHRIGQTRPTHVHRFIIRGTVESRMYSLLRSKSSSMIRTGSRDTENSNLTVGDLAQLFTDDESEGQRGDSLPSSLGQPEDHEETETELNL